LLRIIVLSSHPTIGLISPELRDAIRAALEAAAGVLSPVQIQLLTSAK
jgi:hypothetical protein